MKKTWDLIKNSFWGTRKFIKGYSWCKICNGTGKINGKNCPNCNGLGKMLK